MTKNNNNEFFPVYQTWKNYQCNLAARKLGCCFLRPLLSAVTYTF